MFTSGWIKKTWYKYIMEYYSATKKWNNTICSNMDGPGNYHIKWIKLEKDKFHITSLIGRIFKNDTNELNYKMEADSDLENELMVSRQEEWEGGIDWEFGMDMYTLLYLKCIINQDLMHSTGNSAQYFVTT